MRVTLTIPIPLDALRVIDALRDPIARHARIEGDATLVLEIEERGALEELGAAAEPPAPARKGGWPKGRPRGPRKPRAGAAPSGEGAA